MYSVVAEDLAQTTKPQVAVAFNINPAWEYVPWVEEMIIEGFQFVTEPDLSIPDPRADIFLLATPAGDSGAPTEPVYRMRYVQDYGGNPNNANWALVRESEITGPLSFYEAGYQLDGKEGYIYSLCEPEPACIPVGAVKIYRGYNASWDSHAVYTEDKIEFMDSIGFDTDFDVRPIGYAYPNVDTDSDGLVDGIEYLIGTEPTLQDSDCDGVDDEVEFPIAGVPVSDPLDFACIASS